MKMTRTMPVLIVGLLLAASAAAAPNAIFILINGMVEGADPIPGTRLRPWESPNAESAHLG